MRELEGLIHIVGPEEAAQSTAAFLKEKQKRLAKIHPRKFPVEFRDFLRLVVKGKYVPDREKTFRDFVRDSLHVASYKKPTLGQIADAMGKHRGRELGELDFSELANWFLIWRENRDHEQRRNAALARWKKKR